MLLIALFASGCGGSSQIAATSWPGLTTDGEVVYLAFGSHVFAINASNGGEQWRFPQEADRNISFYAAPALGGDGQLIVGGYNNVLYSLNPETGQPNAWTFTGSRNRFIGSPLATDEFILAPSADNHLYAIDFSGALVWDFLTGEPLWTQPAADGETAYLVSLDHHLYAVDLQTGAQNWDVDLGGAVIGAPLVANGLVYAGSFGKTLTAYDAQTGEEKWSFPTSNWVWAGPTIDGETLYFSDIDGTFYAVDAASGTQTWSFAADGGIYSSPLVVDGKIYFATENGTIYAFSTDGEEQLWSQKVVGKIYTSPILVKNLVLVAVMESEKLLIAYDENGIERWNYTPAE